MEELDGPNSGFVRFAVGFLCHSNDIFLVTVANIVPGTILLPIGLLITGWTTQNHVFWLVPDIVSDLNCALLLGRVLRDTYTGRALHLSGLAPLWYSKAPRHT